jgi:hypothetical protein
MFAKYAVYTILHHDTLKKLAQREKVASLREKKRWADASVHILAGRYDVS